MAKLLQKITAIASVSLAILLALSCTSTDIPDLPQPDSIGEVSSSSSIGNSYLSSSDVPQNWCVYPDSRQCFQTDSQTTCEGEGILITYCPYSSSGGNSSSSTLVSSSSSTAVSSSNSTGVISSSSTEISSSSSIGEYGSFEYEGQTYKTVVIGTQTWIAENLNYATSSGSACYSNNNSNCTTYGRLYDWATAMNLPSSCNSASCSGSVTTNHKGICPSGWHIPSNAEWDMLFRYVDGTSGTTSPYTSSMAGRYLKAQSGWNNCGPSGSGNSYLCEDTYGFEALPSGHRQANGTTFSSIGTDSPWWSTYESNASNAHYRYIHNNSDNAVSDNLSKNFLRGVRCIKD